MKSLIILFFLTLFSVNCVIAKLFTAFNSSELKLALKQIRAGDTLEIADGTYVGIRFNLSIIKLMLFII